MKPLLAALFGVIAFSGMAGSQILSTLRFDGDPSLAGDVAMKPDNARTTTIEPDLITVPSFTKRPHPIGFRQRSVFNLSLKPRTFSRVLARMNAADLLQYCPPYEGYCASAGEDAMSEFPDGRSAHFVTRVRYGRIVSNPNGDFMALSVGIHF